MLKITFTLVLSFSMLLLTAQGSIERELKKIDTPEQIIDYLSNNSRDSKLITFNEENHKTTFSKKLMDLDLGKTFVRKREHKNYYYKVIEKEKKLHYRVSYILLDTLKYNIEKIEKLQKTIIKKYHEDANFNLMAKQYSTAKNSGFGGDSGWFVKGTFHTDFEEEVIRGGHLMGDVFVVNIPLENKYYIVLETHKPKEILEVKAIRVTENL